MTQASHAQPTDAQTILTGPRFSRINFNQELNIFRWNYLLNYGRDLANGIRFEIKENYASTLQQISSRDLWKDDQRLEMALDIPITQHTSVHPEFKSHILSDPLAGFDNDVNFYAAGASIVIQPEPNVIVAPRISSKWQTQLEQSDQGLSYGLETQVYGLDIHEYKNDFAFEGEQDVFPERKNHEIRIRHRIERQFYEDTADTLIVFFDRLRRDSFDADPTGVFVRNLIQSSRGVENRLSYRISPTVRVFLRNSIASNDFKVNNLREDERDVRKDDHGFEANSSLSFNLHQEGWFTNLSWSQRSRSRDDRRPKEEFIDPFQTRHPSLGFDTDDVFVNLGLRGGVRLTSRDSLGIYTAVSKFQYDTSDTTNPNSHDQMRWHFSFSHSHKFTPDLRLTWRGNVFLNHFVYVSGSFSGGNNWERVVQLTPEIYFNPSDFFVFRQAFTVRAKYQTYDFEDPSTSNRNVVNRQFLLFNQSNFRISANTRVELNLNLELSEQGKLFYQLWRQQLGLSWRNQEVEILFKNKLAENLFFSPGCSFFQQTRWEHRFVADGTLQKTVKDKHTNLGPVIRLSYIPSENLELVLFGRTQFAYSTSSQTEAINNIDVNLNWVF